MARKKRPRWEMTLFIPDIHFPYHDEQSLQSVLNLIQDIKPDFIVQLGDLIDCYALSDFNRNPKRLLSLQGELDQAKEFWHRIRKLAPKAKLIMREGNHELRLQRTLWRNPELSPLNSLTLPQLLDLETLGIRYYPYNERLVVHKRLMIVHGGFARSKSGYSANAELMRRQISGISGHTHRLGQTFFTSESGILTWVECGYLGTTDYSRFEYIEGTPDWQQGICVGTYLVNGENTRFLLQPIPIINHKFLYNGKLYTPDGILS